MPQRKLPARVGLWLTCGGLTVLAIHHLLMVYEPELSLDNLMLLGGALAGYLVTATGIWLSMAYHPRARLEEAKAIQRADIGRETSDGVRREKSMISEHNNALRHMTSSFLAWCEEQLPDTSPWNSFDQLVREMLTEQLGAIRVRCYQVLSGDEQLCSLSQSEKANEGKCARSGILGHVATVGREFFAADPAHGELIDQLAEDADESWEWVFPIRQNGRPAGLVAVGKLPSSTPLDRDRRQELSVLITAFWKHVAVIEQLRVADKTDKASGLLTRGDFFELATRALADSYAENEPVVVIALALEGLRRLDDEGRWSDRDALVENIGHLIKRRIRTDDIIGRFSDERFVLLLRRLDSSLGRLIAAKIQDTAHKQITQFGGVGAELRVRVGLIGSGFHKQPLEKLLVSAFDAVELAREQNIALYCDLPPAKPESASPTDEQTEHSVQQQRTAP